MKSLKVYILDLQKRLKWIILAQTIKKMIYNTYFLFSVVVSPVYYYFTKPQTEKLGHLVFIPKRQDPGTLFSAISYQY